MVGTTVAVVLQESFVELGPAQAPEPRSHQIVDSMAAEFGDLVGAWKSRPLMTDE